MPFRLLSSCQTALGPAHERKQGRAKKSHQHQLEYPAIRENRRPIGVVPDRDIVVRLMARTGAAAANIEDHQIRRLIVCDGNERLVGVVSLGDIARDYSKRGS
ncbi:CBS domain-containing protein [uncultured Aliiroseovarius sp.]|uniref:CBS domain-containing protein n=1 Tax=Aliiroseovarius sediminis TaxID=2925839 RepID=UPI00338F2C34